MYRRPARESGALKTAQTYCSREDSDGINATCQILFEYEIRMLRVDQIFGKKILCNVWLTVYIYNYTECRVYGSVRFAVAVHLKEFWSYFKIFFMAIRLKFK